MIILFFLVVFIVVRLFGGFGFAFLATWKGVGWNKGGFTAYCAGCGLRLGHSIGSPGSHSVTCRDTPERAVPEGVGDGGLFGRFRRIGRCCLSKRMVGFKKVQDDDWPRHGLDSQDQESDFLDLMFHCLGRFLLAHYHFESRY